MINENPKLNQRALGYFTKTCAQGLGEPKGPTGATAPLGRQGCTSLDAPGGEIPLFFLLSLCFLSALVQEKKKQFLPASTSLLLCHHPATLREREGAMRCGDWWRPSPPGRARPLTSPRRAGGSCPPAGVVCVLGISLTDTSVFQWRARDTARRRKTPRQTRREAKRQ